MKKLGDVVVPFHRENRPLPDPEAMLRTLLRHPDVRRFAERHPELPLDCYRRSLILLSQFVTERTSCRQCPGLEKCPNSAPGHYPVLEQYGLAISLKLTECSKLRSHKESERRRSLIRSHHIPVEIRNATFESVELSAKREEAVSAAIDFCMEFENGLPDKGLYLYGPFGVGKSYIAGAVTNQLASIGIASVMVHLPALVEEMKGAINENSVSDKVDALKTTTVLILDDIGAETLTPWIRDDILSVIFQYRMTEHLPTIYTSNLSLDELEEHFAHTGKGGFEPLKAKRLMERIRPFVRPILVEGRNRRYDQ
ncbi:primosomal protein DnaI [Staphylospora marina]|uniref:primosomal protein DnaI n=1 Tax=Staphylospora marina TaxID=2490858 RepID=UPI0013DE1491|nr:primosomal protein DnaI [Staphylospora marina]